MPIVASRMGHLWDGLCRAYELLGFDQATGRDSVFRDLVLARIIEPTSKADSLRVLAEVGVEPPAYRTLNRRLAGYARPEWRQRIAAACAANAGLGPVGFLDSATGADLRFQAARSYSLISPPRTGRRLIRWCSRFRAG